MLPASELWQNLFQCSTGEWSAGSGSSNQLDIYQFYKMNCALTKGDLMFVLFDLWWGKSLEKALSFWASDLDCFPGEESNLPASHRAVLAKSNVGAGLVYFWKYVQHNPNSRSQFPTKKSCFKHSVTWLLVHAKPRGNIAFVNITLTHSSQV